MNGTQVAGVVLAAVGCAFALITVGLGAMSVSGSAGYGGPSGSVSFGSGSAPWIALGVAAIGVLLVVVGKDRAPPPAK